MPVQRPAAKLIGPVSARVFRMQKLVLFVEDFSDAEFDLMQHYAEKLVARRQEAA